MMVACDEELPGMPSTTEGSVSLVETVAVIPTARGMAMLGSIPNAMLSRMMRPGRDAPGNAPEASPIRLPEISASIGYGLKRFCAPRMAASIIDSMTTLPQPPDR